MYWSDLIQPVKVMNLTILCKNYESKISNIGTRTQTTMKKANNKKNVRFYVLKCVSQIIRKYFKKYLTRRPARYSFFKKKVKSEGCILKILIQDPTYPPLLRPHSEFLSVSMAHRCLRPEYRNTFWSR